MRRPSLADAVAALHDLPVNYDEAAAPPAVTAGWHIDRRVLELGREAPGEPEPGGLLETAGALVNNYEFSDPSILRAAFRYPGDLMGRDMLLEARFLVLRFLLGVRITTEHDEVRDGSRGPERVIGWSYQTLRGHLEQGRLAYELAKELETGRVEFRIVAYSRQAPIRNPVLRLGFRLFGRRTQLKFYRLALARLRGLVHAPPAPPRPGPDGLVRAPSGVEPGRFETFTLRFAHPGR
ncbi:uncharacterized protein (UPF0548 family) [Pseudonocardia hierapolitana]|uniref:Uncharacterized protein (UPF0548 family) n=1 Tax=Pseudonocardia hierapolitana TaxID=1128676 RepID=A0A561SHD4_9PSEU|nr:DUF1990 family protein [Pseudonocardia hierapolitana]TWF74274.1 uncharacterized protein (UPF0548 family) [Pseudonocardia hierapolitana]